jgi:hypothetical protein
LQALAELGWVDGRSLRLDVRWGAGNAERIMRFAKELVAAVYFQIVRIGLSEYDIVIL